MNESRIIKSIATIHHLSASGGTIICRCLAAMPALVVLSELNPLAADLRMRFNPLSPIQVYQAVYGDLTLKELKRSFLNQVDLIHEKCSQSGLQLVIRDHSHTDFLRGEVGEHKALREFLRERYETLSVATIRHPVDSYLGMLEKGWASHLKGFNEYCQRYLLFADHYNGLPWFRYEDFVASPDRVLNCICTVLGLPFDANFRVNLSKTRLTGDSGRSGDEIARRPRRPYSRKFRREVANSELYAEICQRFGYEKELP